jgi:predicted dehydrogenase
MFSPEAAKADGYYKNLCMYLSDKDTHDQGIAVIEYENGATASHSEYFATPVTNRHYLIEGTGGHGEADLHGQYVTVQPRWSGDVIRHQIAQERGGHGGADPGMIQTFFDCIRKGKRPTASGVDGTWSVALGVAAEVARAEKRVVELSELLDPKSDLLC